MSDETVIIDLKDLIPTSNEEWRLAALQLGADLRRETVAPDEVVGLIDIRREGRYFHYRLRRDAVDAYVPGLSDRISHLAPS